jgi:hypothetical protein
MARTPEFWGFVGLSVVVLVAGGALTVIGGLAYRRERNRSLLGAVAGFGLITAGLLVEPAYETGVEYPMFLTGVELLQLQILERIVVIAGIGTIIYSLVRY